jgi:hypothetical protein
MSSGLGGDRGPGGRDRRRRPAADGEGEGPREDTPAAMILVPNVTNRPPGVTPPVAQLDPAGIQRRQVVLFCTV